MILQIIKKTRLVFGLFLLFAFAAALPAGAADMENALTECAKIRNNAARLKCFDKLARQPSIKEESVTTTIEKKESVAITAGEMETSEAAAKQTPLSVMEKHWDMSLDPRKERNIFVLWPYRPCYFLPLAYNFSPNKDAALDFDPDAKAKHNEVKFQLSFKFKLWRDIIRDHTMKDIIEKSTGVRGVDLWVAYTQQSFWQLYNKAFSAPFRDTNYEPELLLNFRLQREIPYLMGTKLQFINVGFNHQSNGRSEPLSRSWNRIVANVGLEKNFGTATGDSFELLLKTWYRLPEDDADDDNPDLSRYMGYGELWGTLYWKKQRFALMLRNNLRSDNKGAVQLEWSIPLASINENLAPKISLYVQYFNGYGESLLDYNKNVNRISAGLMLADWY